MEMTGWKQREEGGLELEEEEEEEEESKGSERAFNEVRGKENVRGGGVCTLLKSLVLSICSSTELDYKGQGIPTTACSVSMSLFF